MRNVHVFLPFHAAASALPIGMGMHKALGLVVGVVGGCARQTIPSAKLLQCCA